MTMTDPTPRPGLAAAKKRDLIRHVGKLERKLHRARLRIAQLLHHNGVLAARIRVLEADRDSLETKLGRALSADTAAIHESNRQRMLRAEATLEQVGGVLARIADDILHVDQRAIHGYAAATMSTPTLVWLAGECAEALTENRDEPVRQAAARGLIGQDD